MEPFLDRDISLGFASDLSEEIFVFGKVVVGKIILHLIDDSF